MPRCLEHGAQVLVVVNLAVIDGPDTAVLIAQRLLSRGEIDDAQASVSESRPLIDVRSILVRAAMRQRGLHAQQPAALVRVKSFGGDDTSNSAHGGRT